MISNKSDSKYLYQQDLERYNGKPGRFLKLFLYLFRKLQTSSNSLRLICKNVIFQAFGNKPINQNGGYLFRACLWYYN